MFASDSRLASCLCLSLPGPTPRVREEGRRPVTNPGLLSALRLCVSFYAEAALHVDIINFDFETVQVTWNTSECWGTNLTFVYQ